MWKYYRREFKNYHAAVHFGQSSLFPNKQILNKMWAFSLKIWQQYFRDTKYIENF